MHIACCIVRDLKETELAKEFVTSFAPIFQASRKQKIIPIAKI